MCRNPYIAAFWMLIVLLLSLASCGTFPETPPQAELLLSTPAQINTPCDACDQATLAAALTQQQNDADYQAAATAEIVRANAQATWDSANATLSAAQTQEQNNANIIAAQIAATAEVARANAQATVISAGSTQSAAFTQDAIGQTQMADLATTNAQVVLNQQNRDALAASTQTAIADNIATQTQVAVATSQWYADQTRQREEQRQGPIAFLWMWCFPLFVVLFAILVLWGFWRWQKLQRDRQRALDNPVDQLQLPVVEVTAHQRDEVLPYLERNIVDYRDQLTQPETQVQEWLDDVKSQLRSSDKKDEDDHTDH